MQDIIWFGKHKGKNYKDVMSEAPAYALWAHQNVAGFCLSPSELQTCIFNSGAGLPAKARGNPTWMEDEEDEDDDDGGWPQMHDFHDSDCF